MVRDFSWKIIFRNIPVILLAGIFFSCENDLKEVEQFNLDDNAPDQQTEEIELIVTDSGRVNLTLSSAIVEEYMEEKLTKLKGGFILKFYNPQGDVRSFLSAKNGEIYTFDKKMKAMDSVVFKNIATDQVLYTEELIWDQTTHKIFSSKNVRIVEKNNKVLTGVGLITDESFNDPVILRPSGEYYLKKKDTTE